MSKTGVSVTQSGHVALVEFGAAPNNHVSVGLMRELADALAAVDADPGCRAVVLASPGKTFCAGAELTATDGIGGSGMNGISGLYEQAVRLFAVATPIVAAVQGAAVGAGLGLALTADFRVAAPEARFCANFVKLGFHPGFGLSYTLPRLIGPQRASLMFLTGGRVKADEALAWGLVDRLAAAGELRAAAHALAVEIAENAPLAVVATRATLRRELAAAVLAHTAHEHAQQSLLRGTEDFAEGVRAVQERRAGDFVGR